MGEMGRKSAGSIRDNMDDLLEQMSRLADEAGDWRDHLPYAAAAGFLKDERYHERYGVHVDECQYCQRLVDALHPGEEMLATLVSQAREMPQRVEGFVNVADAVADASWYLDNTRGVLVDPSRTTPRGPLWNLAQARQSVTKIILETEGPESSALAPWAGTIALSLDTSLVPNVTDRGNDWFADTMEDVASLLLASGYRVAHADDLRPGSISARIVKLACHHGLRRIPTQASQSPTNEPDLAFGATGYCAWPIHIGMPVNEVEKYEGGFGQQGIVKWLTLEGETRPFSYFAKADRREPAPHEWDHGLIARRNTMVHDSLACIVAGGSTVIGHEAMPSVAQDALVSLRNQRPLYVLGGLGGCAQEIATVLRLTDAQPKVHGRLHDMAAFSDYIGPEHLHNGLNALENQTLAETTDVEEATTLVLRGLDRVVSQQRNWP